MKNTFSTLSVLIVLLLAGCNQNQAMVKDLAGDWQIRTVTYRLPEGDSTVTGPRTGTFHLEACKWEQEKDNQCNGYYQFSEQNRIRFGYNATRQENKINIYVLDQPQRSKYNSVEGYKQAQAAFWGSSQPNLHGIWKINRKTGQQLEIYGWSLINHYGNPGADVKSAETIILLTR